MKSFLFANDELMISGSHSFVWNSVWFVWFESSCEMKNSSKFFCWHRWLSTCLWTQKKKQFEKKKTKFFQNESRGDIRNYKPKPSVYERIVCAIFLHQTKITTHVSIVRFGIYLHNVQTFLHFKLRKHNRRINEQTQYFPFHFMCVFFLFLFGCLFFNNNRAHFYFDPL